MDSILQIRPDRLQNRLDIISSIAFGLILPTVAVGIHFILKGQKEYNATIAEFFLLLFYIFIFAINIFSKKTQVVILNNKDRLLLLKYLTLFKNENSLIISYDKLSFTYNVKHSKYPPLKYSLRLFTNDKKTYEIISELDGFNKGQLDEIVNQLEHRDVKRSR